MEALTVLINNNIIWLTIVMGILIIVGFALAIKNYIAVKDLTKRYDFFTGGNRRADYNLETMVNEHIKKVNEVIAQNDKILKDIEDLQDNVDECFQKIGIIRYNPFEEMGGNLCFAVALLDAKDNGFVLNGIHSRTGSFTYAKPIELGVSKYILSEEEIKALKKAQNKNKDEDK